MELKVFQRKDTKKSEIKALRRIGSIPGVIYAKGASTEKISVRNADWETVKRQISPGALPVTIFSLTREDGTTCKAIVKEIQYHLTSYNVTHLDLLMLSEKVPVEISVPLFCKGVEECAGLKLGGFLRLVMRSVKVRCLPKDIPQNFTIDVKDLKVSEAIRVSDIAFPKGVQPLDALGEVAIVIGKRQ